MAPSAIEVLKTKLKLGLAEPDAAQKRQKLLDTINEGAPGFDLPAHRHARVERARLAAQIMNNPEVSDAGAAVIDLALAKVLEAKTKADQEKLRATITAAELKEVDKNLALLAAEKREYTAVKREVEMAKQMAAAAAAKKVKPKEEEDGLVNTLAGVTDSFLPEKMTKNMSQGGKALLAAGTGLAVVAGVLWLFNRGKKSAQAGAEEAGKSGMGFFGKALIFASVGFAAFTGYNLYKMAQKYGSLEAMLKAKRGERREKKEPWIKYGLTENEYKKAIGFYKTWEHDKVRTIFKCTDEKNCSAAYFAFMQEMKETRTDTIDIKGIPYRNAEAAIDSYEDSVKGVLSALGQWVKDNKHLFMVGAALAWKTGLLRILGNTALGVANMAKEAAIFLGKSTVKGVKNHPILALLTLGGAVMGVRALLPKDKEKILMPADINALVKSLNAGGSLFISDTRDVDIEPGLLDTMRDAAGVAAQAGDDVVGWAVGHVHELAPLADKALADKLIKHQYDIIAENHEIPIEDLMKYLEIQRSKYHDTPRAGPFSKAIGALENYRDLYLLVNATELKDANNVKHKELLVAFTELKTALSHKDVDIDLQASSGKVSWRQGKTGEVKDLGVDPTIRDRDKIANKSLQLDHGQVGFEFFANAFVQQLGLIQGNNEKNNEILTELTGSKLVAVAIGNLVYIIEEWDGDTIRYVVAPIELLWPGGLMEDRDGWNGWLASFGSATAVATVMTLSVGVLSRVRRLYVGGGSISVKGRRGKKLGVGAAKLALHLNPITSPAMMLNRARRARIDSIIWSSAGQYLPDSGNALSRLSAGKAINNRLRDARIRPEWIRIVENAIQDPSSADMGTLQSIQMKLGIKKIGTYKTVEHYMRRFLDIVTFKKMRGKQTGTQTSKGPKEVALECQASMIGKLTIIDRASADGTVSADVTNGSDMYFAVSQALGGVSPEEIDGLVDEEVAAGDENARVEFYKMWLADGATVEGMVMNGADVEDLLKAGADVDQTVKAVLALGDEDLRAKGMEALIDAGHPTELITEAKKHGSKFHAEIEAAVKASPDASKDVDVQSQLNELKTAVPIPTLDPRVATYKQFLDQGRPVADMVKNGADVGDLLKAGADPDETLKAVQGLTDAGLRVDGLKALKAAGVEIKTKPASATPKPTPAKKPKSVPTALDKLKSTVDVVEKKTDIADKGRVYYDMMTRGKISLADLVKAGADPVALHNVGVTIDDLRDAGVSEPDLAKIPLRSAKAKPKPAPTPAKKLKPKPGSLEFTKQVVDILGKVKDPAKRASDYREMLKTGTSLETLVQAGADLQDLKNAGATVEELRKAGADPKALAKLAPPAKPKPAAAKPKPAGAVAAPEPDPKTSPKRPPIKKNGKDQPKKRKRKYTFDPSRAGRRPVPKGDELTRVELAKLHEDAKVFGIDIRGKTDIELQNAVNAAKVKAKGRR